MFDAFLTFIAGFLIALTSTVSSWFVAPENTEVPATIGTTSAEMATVPPPQVGESTVEKTIPSSPQKTPPVSQGVRPSVVPATPSLQSESVPVEPKVSLPEPTKRMPGAMIAASETQALVPTGLDAREILRLTNEERARAGVAPLQWNPRLAAMAEAKNIDMITLQYFAHVSPSGKDIGDLAGALGYSYRRVGENLALGDFASSSHVVTGWMRSTGHRENILEPDFTELGVSVMRGAWEGREVWWATQEFGRPMPDCPEPDDLLRKKIEIFDGQLFALKETLERAKIELDAVRESSLYRTKVEEYNLLVDLFNGILETQKEQVAKYNASVSAYNACIGE